MKLFNVVTTRFDTEKSSRISCTIHLRFMCHRFAATPPQKTKRKRTRKETKRFRENDAQTRMGMDQKKERENPRATPFKQLSRVQVVIALDKTYRRLTVNSIHI